MQTMQQIFKTLNFIHEIELREELLENSQIIDLKKGDVIVREGEYVKVLPIVLEGNIRVYQTNGEREILLYYVEPGQTCIMSLSACFFNNESPSKAVATEDTTIVAIPTRYITQWQKQYKSWNEYIIKTFRNRYDDLLSTFESVTFEHTDQRIMEYLNFRKEKDATNLIEISHQNLANELGTTRVVVSRILKQFELSGKVVLHRRGIELI